MNQRWKMAVVTWIAVYPAITGLLLIGGPYLEGLPVAGKTLVLTVILVPLMHFGLVPFLSWLLRRWLQPVGRAAQPTRCCNGR